MDTKIVPSESSFTVKENESMLTLNMNEMYLSTPIKEEEKRNVPLHCKLRVCQTMFVPNCHLRMMPINIDQHRISEETVYL